MTPSYPHPRTPEPKHISPAAATAASSTQTNSDTILCNYGTPTSNFPRHASLFANPTILPKLNSLPTTTQSSTVAPKRVTLRFGTHDLSGSLYYITPGDYLNGLYARFFDILPSVEPPLGEVQTPFVLIHAVQGLSWVDGRELAKSLGFLDAAVGTAQLWRDHFVAVTDDKLVFESGLGFLGMCRLVVMLARILPA